jgi:hypothetical protein
MRSFMKKHFSQFSTSRVASSARRSVAEQCRPISSQSPGRRVFLAGQHGLDRAMHQQVGIAADRRGEVGVVLVGQAEVADVVRAVHRLAQRAQHDRLQQLEIRARLDLLEQLGVVLGLRIVAAAQRQAELAEEGCAGSSAFPRTRRFVDAVEAGLLVLGQEIRGADVGRQHAFLDDAVGVVAHHRHDVLDLALVVEQHLRFGGLEIDRAALAARLVQAPANSL